VNVFFCRLACFNSVVRRCLHKVYGLALSSMNQPVKTTELSTEFSTSDVHQTMVWKDTAFYAWTCMFSIRSVPVSFLDFYYVLKVKYNL